MAVLGLRFCARAFSSCGKWGHSSSRCASLSLSRRLLLRSTGSRRAGSVTVAHGPSCSVARGIFPDQGSNPCALHWQADSQPLRHQGSPCKEFLKVKFRVFTFEFLLFFPNCPLKICTNLYSYLQYMRKPLFPCPWQALKFSKLVNFPSLIGKNIYLIHFICIF